MTGIILAGGASRRMGRDKAACLWEGVSFLERAIQALQPLTTKILVSSDNPRHGLNGVQRVEDLVKDKGPLMGLFSALSVSQDSLHLVLSCDYPLVDTQLLRLLSEDKTEYSPICVFTHKKEIHPFPGLYPGYIRTVLGTYLSENRLSVKEFLRRTPTQCVEIPNHMAHQLANMNTPDDLKTLQ